MPILLSTLGCQDALDAVRQAQALISAQTSLHGLEGAAAAGGGASCEGAVSTALDKQTNSSTSTTSNTLNSQQELLVEVIQWDASSALMSADLSAAGNGGGAVWSGGGGGVDGVLTMSDICQRLKQAARRREWMLILNAHAAPELVRRMSRS
jgi:hypothetical protein